MLANLKLKPIDPILLILSTVISILGAVAVFTTTYVREEGISKLFWNQILFYIVGFVLFILLSQIDLKIYKRLEVIISIIILNFLLLFWVLAFGAEINGAKRWIGIGGFTLQPSEFAKIAVIIFTAFILSFKFKSGLKKGFNIYKSDQNKKSKTVINSSFKKRLITIGISFVFLLATIFLVFQQNSLGNSLLITAIYLLMFLSLINIDETLILGSISAALSFIASLSIFYSESFNLLADLAIEVKILILGIITMIILFISKMIKANFWLVAGFGLISFVVPLVVDFSYDHLLLDYQKVRIESFLASDNDQSLSINWNREQSKTAVGAGQVFGRGIMKGTQVNSGLLPFPETDFIFASIVEQAGFIGGVVVILLYYFLIIRILSFTRDSSTFGKLICVGVSSMIILNVFQNIGMNIGILPITGVPLPLVSYGGSSILTTFIGLGIVQSVYTKNSEKASKIVKVEI